MGVRTGLQLRGKVFVWSVRGTSRSEEVCYQRRHRRTSNSLKNWKDRCRRDSQGREMYEGSGDGKQEVRIRRVTQSTHEIKRKREDTMITKDNT